MASQSPVLSGQNPIFVPGPTNTPDSLRKAMNVPMSDHRSREFAELLAGVLEDAKKIFKTETGHVVMIPSSGTGGWEAAITNTLSPGDKVLAARIGLFSKRWIELCERHNLDVEVVECVAGEATPADRFHAVLSADSDHLIKAVLVTHNETATGVRSDVAAVRRALDDADHPAMLYVDCVSSLGSMDFRMDEWGVDLAVTGSQKGLMLATGMAIIGVSPKAFEATETATCPRCYFDFRDMVRANAQGGYPYTPPIQLVHGLGESLKMLLDEGLENVFARHHRMAEGVREAVRAWGLELCAKRPELYSDTVSTIYVPAGFDSDVLTAHAFDAYGVSYGIGLGDLAGKAFRIGHLGSLTDAMALSGIATIEMAMKDLGYPIELGAGVAAAQSYYRKTRDAAVSAAA